MEGLLIPRHGEYRRDIVGVRSNVLRGILPRLQVGGVARVCVCMCEVRVKWGMFVCVCVCVCVCV
jgi:hypothetical protein